MMNIYEQALKLMDSKDIDHHESDLYLRKNAISDKLVKEYDYLKQVTTFRDNIDHVMWYEIPCAYYTK